VLGFGLSREPADESGAQRQVRHRRPQPLQQRDGAGGARAAHPLKHRGVQVLKGNVDVLDHLRQKYTKK
jgi:hypothetical protein